jgi:hypothetical protein
MTHSFDITTALVAERQHTLREEAHHHRLGRIARLNRRRGGARRAPVVQPGGGGDVVTTPLPTPAPTTEANQQQRTAA